MTDPLPTVYAASPHTVAKHRILEAYLKRWLPILDRQAKAVGRTHHRLLYFDGFAGAGEYDGQVRGSPQVPIDVVESHAHEFSCPVEVVLVERRPDRAAYLKDVLSRKKPVLLKAKCLRIHDPIEGDCEEEVRRMISESDRSRKPLGPAFFFLDQFGYSSFSMDLIQVILSHEICEVFSYLNWSLLHPFMTDETKHAGITKAFGGEEWKGVLGLSGKEKEDAFRRIYLDALRSRGGCKYAYPFAMRDNNHRVIYWLFFCTNNIRGLEEMKRAMWSVDRSGGFEFSDKFVSDRSSMFEYSDADLARDLVSELAGKVLTVRAIGEHALVHTPACKYLEALRLMEKERMIRIVNSPVGRRAGSFGDYHDMLLEVKQESKQNQGTLFGS